jgi:hypothetical protein
LDIPNDTFRKLTSPTTSEPGSPLPCTIQDPAYSTLDHEYLLSLGLHPVDDPDAFSRIDTNSLVLHIGTYLSLAWWICDGVWPTAMVCNGWSDIDPDDAASYPEYCATGVCAMFWEYDHVPFIGVGDWASSERYGVNLYWRKGRGLRE